MNGSLPQRKQKKDLNCFDTIASHPQEHALIGALNQTPMTGSFYVHGGMQILKANGSNGQSY